MNSSPRLAIVTTHPIQYHAPLFRLLKERNRLAVKVFYTWSQAQDAVYDPGFGKEREWDIPLLDGYEYSFVPNQARKPGSHHFLGIRNSGLIREIEQWKPDAVWVFGWSFYSHLGCLRHFRKKLPIYFRGDSTLIDENRGLKAFLRRRFLTWVYSHVDTAFYVGQNNRHYYLAHGLKETQLRFAPHAVENERFSGAVENGERLHFRSALGIDSTDFVLLFAGKLEPKKNPFFLLQLAEKMEGQRIKFLLVGNGVLEKKLKEAAGKDGRIKFLGFQNQSRMPALYRCADCFILPSTGPGETWGLAANEAMASGLPVLLSGKAGGAIDLVGENGLVFQPSEVEKVAAYITYLKEDREALKQAGLNSLERIKDFSLEAIAAAVENELLRTGTTPGKSLARSSF